MGVFLALAFPALSHAARHCEGANRKTLAETSGVRVYKITRGEREDYVYACLKRNGRKTWLWFHGRNYEEFHFVSPIRIKGPLVAFGEGTLGREHEQSTTIVVENVRTRRTIFAQDERPGTRIRDLELTHGGSVAWIGEDRYRGSIHPVRKHDADGTVDLDDGVGVDPDSLTRTESELQWTKNGEPRSAPFR